MSASALNINSLCQCEALRPETKKEITGGNRFLLCGEYCWNERDLVAGGVVKDASDPREAADWIVTALVSKLHGISSGLILN
jgi:hypothetical protein